MPVNEATLRQNEAADPTQNTWLSANAGSGKTRVLTDRVARLLLAGVSPQNILCLTYTKAAASEMQNRLFKRLGAWAMKPDGELRKELAGLDVGDIPDLAQARRLFAGAIETPGGLKIQTIHSFCASILRRFPLEAGVPLDFREIDERSTNLLLAEIADEMASGPERQLIENLAEIVPDSEFSSLLRDISSHRETFSREVSQAEIWGWFGLAPEIDESTLEAETLHAGDGPLISRLVEALASGSPADVKNATTLREVSGKPLSYDDLPILEKVFLTGSKAQSPFTAKIGSFPTKNTRNGPAAPLMPALEALMVRVQNTRERRLALEAARKTSVLHRFARPFLAQYTARKQAAGWLDFDDLITIANRLLKDPGLAAWVLYRLDGGIDHILIDEAQDTSPAQWQIIESLAREFTAGESARSDRERTVFVVGDVKQSIYSFQGADPAQFDQMWAKFRNAFRQVGRDVIPLQLEYSFRSSRAILDLVDHVFAELPGLGDGVKHIAFHEGQPGRVDLWPAIAPPEKPEKPSWTDPVDAPAPQDASVVLAEKVAEAISEMIDTGSLPDKDRGFRAITPGDIMVLVQKRSQMFHQIIRACKARGLAVAGADRLRIEAELAVKDIVAVLSFLATPEDDLSLAAALRSPLFGLDENDLFCLAHDRGGKYLWQNLRESADKYPQAVATLSSLRNSADFLRPYDLIEHILTRHEGRRHLLSRLGPEAEDGIDALLSQALAYESAEVPSLTGFLNWLAAGDVEIKRQMDSAGDQIRVMTVHGSKGLESPIVFLPDTAKPRNPRAPSRLIETADGTAWRVAKDEAPSPIRDALRDQLERNSEENKRLLYVAMTRAESWLVVAAAGDVGKEGDGSCWYRLAEAGMRRAGAVNFAFPAGEGLRLQHGPWSPKVIGGHRDHAQSTESLPRWATTPPPKPPLPAVVLNPSKLGGPTVSEKIASEISEPETALRHGRQIHRLLEILPDHEPATWPKIAQELLSVGQDAAEPTELDHLLLEAKTILSTPELAFLFAPDTLAEVELTAPVATDVPARIHGIIDRLVIGPEHVLAVDFKTNRSVPNVPEDIPVGILRQMGAYEAALEKVFPNKKIKTAILWTADLTLMYLPAGLALRAFGRLDATIAPT